MVSKLCLPKQCVYKREGRAMLARARGILGDNVSVYFCIASVIYPCGFESNTQKTRGTVVFDGARNIPLHSIHTT